MCKVYSLNFKNVIKLLGEGGSPGGSVVKNLPIGDLGSISGLGSSPEKEMATHSSILAWRIPWRGEPGRLQSMGVAKEST